MSLKNVENPTSSRRILQNQNPTTRPMTNERSQFQENPRQISHSKLAIFLILLLFGMSLPIGQIMVGSHYKSNDNSHASIFLMSNGVTYFYVICLAYCKFSKRSCGCQTGNFFSGIAILPIFSTFCIGIFLYGDFSRLSHTEKPVLPFYFAFVLNFLNYFIATGYMIMIILNYFGLGISMTSNERPLFFCCGERI